MAAAGITLALLVPLAVFGAPALGRSTSAASAQYQYRVEICHLTGSKKHPAHTIFVSSASVPAHLRHGDHLGPCTGSETPKKHGGKTTTTPGSAGATHGHGKGK